MTARANWEYTTLPLDRDQLVHYLQDILNAEGSEGWDLATVIQVDESNWLAVLKRPRQ